MNKITKKTLFYLLVFIIAIGSVYISQLIGKPDSPNEIYVKHISIKGNVLNIKGSTTSSAKFFKGYEYTINKDKAVIRLKYGLIGRTKTGGEFNIDIQDKNLKNVHTVFLQGKTKEDKKEIYKVK